jgi:hypothetical protein
VLNQAYKYFESFSFVSAVTSKMTRRERIVWLTTLDSLMRHLGPSGHQVDPNS